MADSIAEWTIARLDRNVSTKNTFCVLSDAAIVLSSVVFFLVCLFFCSQRLKSVTLYSEHWYVILRALSS